MYPYYCVDMAWGVRNIIKGINNVHVNVHVMLMSMFIPLL